MVFDILTVDHDVALDELEARVAETVALVAQTERAFGGTGLTRAPSPYELRLTFVVPRLCKVENGNLFEFDSTFLMESQWRLGGKDASLPEHYNPLVRPESRAGILDVTGTGEVQITEVHEKGTGYETGAYRSMLPMPDWTLEGLVAWLDSHIPHQDIPAEESAAFLLKVLRGLMAKYSIQEVGVLAFDRFRLRDEVEALIQRHRLSERKSAFQKYLLPESALEVSDANALNFHAMTYEPSWPYDGNFQFRKHYFSKPGELAETTPSGALTEEFLCARFLDDMSEIKFWVRNLSGKSSSFRLHTSTDWFYPDFICKLRDGRVLAVEYKGKYIYDGSDAQEKRVIGGIWEERSKGRCLFAMPTDRDFSVIVKKVRD